MSARRLLRGLLWFIAIYQFAMGFLLLMPPQFSQLVVSWYGATVDWTPQFMFILKPLGAYMLMTGLIAAASARAEIPHPAITTSLAALFTINALYRILRFDFVRSTFAIGTSLLATQVIVLLALAAALVWLSRSARESAATAPRVPERA